LIVILWFFFNGSKATTNASLCHFNYERAFRDVTIEKWQRRIISINLPKHNYLQYSCVCVCVCVCVRIRFILPITMLPVIQKAWGYKVAANELLFMAHC